jgi:hypothetical protein
MSAQDKNPTEELIGAAKKAVADYESYLLDQLSWKELADTMTFLRKRVKEWETKMRSSL